MARHVGEIEPESRQGKVEQPDKFSAFEFAFDKNIAQQSDALAGDNGVDRVQFLTKHQSAFSHIERHILVDPLGYRQPTLPCRRMRFCSRPSGVDEWMLREIRRALDRVL
jgi:hypothetical protein